MIYFMGDIHGKFEHVIEFVQRDRPDAIVLLGDMECDFPLHAVLAPIRALTEIWYIHGNHDTDQAASWQFLVESELADRNLHGRVANVAGVKVAGLGGVFRAEVWNPPEPAHYASYREFERKNKRSRHKEINPAQEGRFLKHRSTIFPDDYAALMKQRADILVTHEAPSCHPHGAVALDTLARSMRVQTLFHGHHHDCLDYSAWSRENGINAFGVGLRGITDEHGTTILAGELDEPRRSERSG